MTRRIPSKFVTCANVGLEDLDVAAILRRRLVTPVFQPIVDLATGAVVAAEALARGPSGIRFERPNQLFATAAEAGQIGPQDLLCAERALKVAVLPPMLFPHAEPAVPDQPLSPRLLDLTQIENASAVRTRQPKAAASRATVLSTVFIMFALILSAIIVSRAVARPLSRAVIVLERVAKGELVGRLR